MPGPSVRASGLRGGAPEDLPLVDAAHKPEAKPRDVFIYFIHEGKLRAPAAAMALIERLRLSTIAAPRGDLTGAIRGLSAFP